MFDNRLSSTSYGSCRQVSSFLPSFSYLFYTIKLDLELLTAIFVCHVTIRRDADVIFAVGNWSFIYFTYGITPKVSK